MVAPTADNSGTVAVDVSAIAQKIQESLTAKYQWLHNELVKEFNIFAKHPLASRIADKIHFACNQLEVSHFHVQQAVSFACTGSPEGMEKLGEEALARGDVVLAPDAPAATAEPPAAAPQLTVVEGGKAS